MRVKRLDKFKNNRKRKTRNLVVFGIIFPCSSIVIAYFITSTIILPSLGK